MRFRWVISSALIVLGFAGLVAHAEQARVVFFGTTSHSKAVEAVATITEQFDAQATYSTITLRGEPYYRITSALGPAEEIRRSIAHARVNGYPTAWYLVELSTESNPSPTSVTDRPPRNTSRGIAADVIAPDRQQATELIDASIENEGRLEQVSKNEQQQNATGSSTDTAVSVDRDGVEVDTIEKSSSSNEPVNDSIATVKDLIKKAQDALERTDYSSALPETFRNDDRHLEKTVEPFIPEPPADDDVPSIISLPAELIEKYKRSQTDETSATIETPRDNSVSNVGDNKTPAEGKAPTNEVVSEVTHIEDPPASTEYLNSSVIPSFATADINIDGVLDEPIWLELPTHTDMRVVAPDTLAKPEHRTIVRMFSTPEGLYVAAEMHQSPETLIRRLSARDIELNRDSFGITLDTSGEGLYGFWFTINLGGTKADGKVAAERSFTYEWDGAWLGETSVINSGWTAELLIPWSIVTMPKDIEDRQMRLFLSRKVAYRDEMYGWPPLPFTQPQFMSAMQPLSLRDVNPRGQWELFPYLSNNSNRIDEDAEQRIGLSYSWRPVPNMQFTGTVNPDFGAVESDAVVINLTAYETYFPEKRLFFLEGNEVFITTPRANMRGSSPRGSGARSAPSTWRSEPTSMLNTRRIGGAARHVDIPDGVEVEGVELSRPTSLLGAMKFVGSLGSQRFGILTAIEDEPELIGSDEETGEEIILTAPERTFAVGRWLSEFGNSESRRAIGYMGTVADYPTYNAIVHGIDTHYVSPGARLSIDTQFLMSDKDDETGYGFLADLRYFGGGNWTHSISLDFTDDRLDISDLGFLRRNDERGFNYFAFAFNTDDLPGNLRQMRRGLFSSVVRNSDGDIINAYLGAMVNLQFADYSELRLDYSWRPSTTEDRLSRDNGSFETKRSNFAKLTYGSDSAKRFAWSIQGGTREGELAKPAFFADIGFTYSPITRLSLEYDYRYSNNEGQLIHQEDRKFTSYDTTQIQHVLGFDYFFSAKQQFRLTLHWVGVQGSPNGYYTVPQRTGPLEIRVPPDDEKHDAFPISQLAAQMRYRWEIAPLSDFFLVYTYGSLLAVDEFTGFDALFQEALDRPIVDILVMKLRYRFGS